MGKKWITKKKGVYWPNKKMKENAFVSDQKIYEKANKDPEKFWAEKAKELIDWFDPNWEKTEEWDPPHFHWFKGAKTNICHNCVDRHLEDKGNQPALIWEPESPEEENRVLTYKDLYKEVQKFANVLKKLGVEKGDVVTFWIPMIPETAIAALACQRIGAKHSIVFTAFSPEAVEDRMKDAESKTLITADGLNRRGEAIPLKNQINENLNAVGAKNCVVVKRTGVKTKMKKGRDHYWGGLMKKSNSKYKPEELDAEHISFLLYTSGTTGKPKGLKHSTGGYQVQAALTMKWVFDFHDGDIFFSTADIGWITGHTYTLYGPLLLGGTTLWYEGSPDYPKPDRWWKIIEKYKPQQFYTAPTALRMMRKKGKNLPDKCDLSSLRVLGSVGEPIDPNTWRWFFEKVGGKRCPIVDTYWQTETGGILISSLPGIGPFVPGVAGPPLPGVDYKVVDEKCSELNVGKRGKLIQNHPFPPGMLRGIYKNPEKYKEEYWEKFGDKKYFSGDGAIKVDLKIGNRYLIKIVGRTDDVLEVAGHRLGSAEIEQAIHHLPEVAEVAVTGKPHKVKGEVPAAFIILRSEVKKSKKLKEKIVKIVREEVGPVATPGAIYFVSGLPSTESGKIIRRFLKSLLKNEKLGDMTTTRNPECLKEIAKIVGYHGPEKF